MDHNDTLHPLARRYFDGLRSAGQIGEYSAQIAKSAVQVREKFDQVRNKQSRSHDFRS